MEGTARRGEGEWESEEKGGKNVFNMELWLGVR